MKRECPNTDTQRTPTHTLTHPSTQRTHLGDIYSNTKHLGVCIHLFQVLIFAASKITSSMGNDTWSLHALYADITLSHGILAPLALPSSYNRTYMLPGRAAPTREQRNMLSPSLYRDRMRDSVGRAQAVCVEDRQFNPSRIKLMFYTIALVQIAPAVGMH